MIAHDDQGEQDENEHTDRNVCNRQIEIEAEFDADGLIDEQTQRQCQQDPIDRALDGIEQCLKADHAAELLFCHADGQQGGVF